MANLSRDKVVEPGQRTGAMKSTWWQGPIDTFPKRYMSIAQPHDIVQPPPRKGKVPVLTTRRLLPWLGPRILPFVLLQYVSHHVFHYTWPVGLVLFLGTLHFLFFAATATRLCIELGAKWSFFDGGAPRDKVPDVKLNHLSILYIIFPFCRAAIGVFTMYDRNEPVRMTYYWPITAFVYTILLDLLFYIYHRSSHEVDAIWRIHKTHHLTKHPSPVLALLADEEQESIEIVLLPLITTLIMKQVVPQFTFQDWWCIQMCIVLGEILGHSGVRAHMEAPLTAPFLRPFGAELVLEDHDLHHRRGWRKSFNYGKQSRLWDKIFGTMTDRIESKEQNIDWTLSVFDPVPEDK